VSRRAGTGAPSYYHHDALGSVVALSGNSGTLSDSYTYTAFGDLRSTTGTSTQPYRYLGNAYDSSSKLYDFHARAYDSSVGRFTSEDPINGSAVMPQTLNPYVYGLNGPLAYTDAGGRQAAPVLQGSALYVAYSAPVVLPAVAAGIEAVGVGAVVLTAGSGLILVGAAVVVVGGLYALSQPMNQQSAQAGQAAEPINPLTDQSQSESTVDKDCLDSTVSGEQPSNLPDFYVDKNGVTIPTSQARMREGFRQAGFPESTMTERGPLNGTAHELPNGVRVRMMNPSGRAGYRASFEKPGSGQVDAYTGKQVQGTKDYSRSRSHVDQNPC
jgi:RHS repeat-associated protein